MLEISTPTQCLCGIKNNFFQTKENDFKIFHLESKVPGFGKLIKNTQLRQISVHLEN